MNCGFCVCLTVEVANYLQSMLLILSGTLRQNNIQREHEELNEQ